MTIHCHKIYLSSQLNNCIEQLSQDNKPTTLVSHNLNSVLITHSLNQSNSHGAKIIMPRVSANGLPKPNQIRAEKGQSRSAGESSIVYRPDKDGIKTNCICIKRSHSTVNTTGIISCLAASWSNIQPFSRCHQTLPLLPWLSSNSDQFQLQTQKLNQWHSH